MTADQTLGLQQMLAAEGFYDGPLDGVFTEELRRADLAFRGDVIPDVRPIDNHWPGVDGVEEFFGRFELGKDGHPTPRWEARNLVQMRLPYPMRLAWQDDVTLIRLRCHKMVARDLGQILAEILAHYGSLSAVRNAGMDLFGGCYFYSSGTDPKAASPHARGIAIDLDPFRNVSATKKPKGYEPKMPQGVVAIFAAHGWSWGGNSSSYYEPAHFQATVNI